MRDKSSDMKVEQLRRRVRYLLVFFMAGLVLSGLTAFPLTWEVNLFQRFLGSGGTGTAVERMWPDLAGWLNRVSRGLNETQRQYPFLFYGTDWLAFAHLVIAIAFWGPLRDPVRNVWVIEFGMVACMLVIPLALICGPLRGIPAWWRTIDCSFGVLGILPLWLARRYVQLMIQAQHKLTTSAA